MIEGALASPTAAIFFVGKLLFHRFISHLPHEKISYCQCLSWIADHSTNSYFEFIKLCVGCAWELRHTASPGAG
jgi:hypothetical protein